MHKEKALQLINQIKSSMKSGFDGTTSSSKFIKWKRDATVAIKQVFGDGSSHSREFASIHYTPKVFNPLRDPDYVTPLRDGLARAEAILDSMVDEIKQFWPEEQQATSESTPMKKAIEVDRDTREWRAADAILKVFITHSSLNKATAEMLKDLLRASLNLDSKSIRCTSVEGHRLPAGATVDAVLPTEVYEAGVVIGLLSPDTVCSVYSLFELGTRWGTKRPLIPLVVKGYSPGSLPRPLSGLNVLLSDNAGDLHQMVTEVAMCLEIQPEPPQAYQSKIDALIREQTPVAAEQSKAGQDKTQKPNDQECQIMEVVGKLCEGSEDSYVTVGDIAQHFSWSRQKAGFYLEELANKKLLDDVMNMSPDIPTKYFLTQPGRRYLIEHGLL